MVNKIGLDAGGTLLKMVYYESGRMHYKKYQISEMEKLTNWLNIVHRQGTVFITGGRAKLLQEKLMLRSFLVNEFQAIVEGSKRLLEEEKGIMNEGYILINIGTGTSIFHVSPNHFERITGTGMGGGTFIGLGTLLAKNSNYSFLIDQANKGDRSKIDLLVKDIYTKDQPPLIGDLTAANFGKVNKNGDFRIEDQLAGLIQMIAENIMLLAIEAAKQKNVKKIVFIGGMLEGNKLLKQTLERFTTLMSLEPIFLSKGIYTGAIGALNSNID